MSTCVPPGWGSEGWGYSPWGGGGPLQQDLPVHLPFDVYCVGPCEEIEHIFQFFLVTGSSNLAFDPLTGDLLFDSFGVGAEDKWLDIAKPVPSIWTLEYTVRFDALPPMLTSVQQAMGRVFVGVWNEQGGSAGLFFSSAGIGYAAHQDDPIVPIPNSTNIITLGEFWTIRMVGNLTTGAIFIYITKSTDLDNGSGHMLRFVLPAPAQTGLHAEHTYVSVLGTAQIHNAMALRSCCLASGSVVPNMPPIADPGNDQEVRLCTIGQLDGTASFDPEGAPITYHWRVTDAPVTSTYCFEGYDGWTATDPSGFTNEFHTRNSLDPALGGRRVTTGDVLVTMVGYYTILSVANTNPADQVITINGYFLESDQPDPHYFKLVQQTALNGAANAKPTFYPDVAGFWRFDLTVSDGQLDSEAAVSVVSVRESAVPRGCTPDMAFIWNYLSDFWTLVEGKEPITAVWSAVAQIVASELLKLWQIDYNKSLRDIQRTMSRKWLYYDLLVQEPFFDLTRVKCLDASAGYLSGAHGQVLPAQPPGPWPPLPLPLQMNPLGYRTNTRLDDQGIQRGDLLVLNGTGYRIDKVVPPKSDEPGGGSLYRGELVLMDPLYPVPSSQALPVDPNWAIVRPVTSSQVDFWGGLVVGALFDGQDWAGGDDAIIEVLDKQTGAYQFLKSKVWGVCEQLPHGAAIDPTPWITYAQDTTGRYELYFVGVFRRFYIPISDRIRDVPYLQQTIKNPPADEVLQRNLDFFIDQFRGRACIRFENVWVYPVVDATQDPPVTNWYDDPTPPTRLWAEFTYVENLSVVESNFGKVAGLTVADLEAVDAQMPGAVDYLSAVQGLWYVYFNSATPWNLRVGAQILLGLPFAEEDGSITEIIPNLNVSATRLLVTDNDDSGLVRSYDFPDGLALENSPVTGLPYQVGDALQQFAPISTGVSVLDWIKDPRWIAPYVQQGTFYEVQKYFLFPVIIEQEAYTLAGALLTRKLILNVKPSYTWPIIVAHFEPDRTDIDVSDQVNMLVTMTLHEGPCMQYPQAHPFMWNAGDTGPVTLFPQPTTDTEVPDAVWHRHENYSGWYSSWKSQYGVQDYPDVGYADFYEEAVTGIAFPHVLPTMPKPDGSTAMYAQAEPFVFSPKVLHIEITHGTQELHPIYTLELVQGGHPFTPPIVLTFDATPPVGEDTYRESFTLPATTNPGDVAIVASLTVGPLGTGTPDWAVCRFTLYSIYSYTSPQMWGHYQASNTAHPWPAGPKTPPYPGADGLCPEVSLEITTYMDWPHPPSIYGDLNPDALLIVQYNTIFILGDPVYPAYVDAGPPANIVVDWSHPTRSVSPGTGDVGWSFGQLLDPPDSPYTGYVSKKFV